MPTLLATAQRTYPRASADVPVPADVYDVMLWRLAFDVAAAHQAGPTGDCGHIRCAGRRGPCEPGTQAQHALRAARNRPVTAPTTQPSSTPPRTPPDPAPIPIGRATVTTANSGRFTDWFTRPATNRRGDNPPYRQVAAAAATAA